MANTDRLINYDQGERMAAALERIASGGDSDDTSWGGVSDAKLRELIAASDAGDIDLANDLGWTLGDVRYFHVNTFVLDPERGDYGVVVEHLLPLFLLDTDHYDLVTPTAGGRTKSAFVVGTKDFVFPSMSIQSNVIYAVQTSNIQSGALTNDYDWSTNIVRSRLNTDFRNALGSMKDIFKQFYVVSGKSSSVSETVRTQDYFTLPSIKEIYGNNVPYRTSLWQNSGTTLYGNLRIINIGTETGDCIKSIISSAEYNATSQLKYFKDAGYTYIIPSTVGTTAASYHKTVPKLGSIASYKDSGLPPYSGQWMRLYRSAFPGRFTYTTDGSIYRYSLNDSSNPMGMTYAASGVCNILGCI